jgi:hypothetical protein
MKPATTIKEILRPPFKRNGRSIYDSAGWLLAILETFGKGFVVEQDKTNVAGDFVVAALNEKWERDFGESSNEDDEEEAGVYCYDCRKFYEDDKGVLRCKDKPGCISVDPDVCEPCPGFEGALSPRWEFSASLGEIHCPNPACDKLWFVYEDGFDWEKWKHCPHCGQRLLPPEGNSNG